MFSDALRELDKNTERYMVEELNKEVADLKEEATALKEETTTLKKELDRRAETITEKDSELAEMASLIQTLTKKLEQYEGAAKETP